MHPPVSSSRRPVLAVAALAAVALGLGLAGCQKTTTTTESPAGTSTTTTTYSTPAMPALSASASQAASDAMRGAGQAASEAMRGASQALGKAGEKLGDAAVTAKVKTALLAAADVKAMQIDVDTQDGVVTLNGSQETPAAVERAVTVARGTDGVRSVENRLAVKGAGG